MFSFSDVLSPLRSCHVCLLVGTPGYAVYLQDYVYHYAMSFVSHKTFYGGHVGLFMMCAWSYNRQLYIIVD